VIWRGERFRLLNGRILRVATVSGQELASR
jgi:hypothetical protein